MTAESENWTTAQRWVFLGSYDVNALFTLWPQRKT